MTQEEEKIFAGVLFCPAAPELKEIKLFRLFPGKTKKFARNA